MIQGKRISDGVTFFRNPERELPTKFPMGKATINRNPRTPEERAKEPFFPPGSGALIPFRLSPLRSSEEPAPPSAERPPSVPPPGAAPKTQADRRRYVFAAAGSGTFF